MWTASREITTAQSSTASSIVLGTTPAASEGAIPKIPLNLTLLKGSQIVGVFWGEAVRRDPEGHAANMAALFDLARAGKVAPRITHRLPLSRINEAVDELVERPDQSLGVVLQPNAPWKPLFQLYRTACKLDSYFYPTAKIQIRS